MKIFIGPEAANCALDTQATIKRKKATESKEGLGGGGGKKENGNEKEDGERIKEKKARHWTSRLHLAFRCGAPAQ